MDYSVKAYQLELAQALRPKVTKAPTPIFVSKKKKKNKNKQKTNKK